MAISIGVGPAQGQAFPVTSLDVTLNSCTAGRTLMIVVCWDSVSGSNDVNTPTCTSETITAATDTVRSGTDSVRIYRLASLSAGGNKTVNVTCGSSQSIAMGVIEVVGASTGAVDSATTGTGSTSNPSITLTTNSANCAIFANIATSYGSGEPTAGSGESYTIWNLPDVDSYSAAEYVVDCGASGNQTVDFVANSGSWGIAAVALAVAGGAAATRGTPFGQRGTAFGGGRGFYGIVR